MNTTIDTVRRGPRRPRFRSKTAVPVVPFRWDLARPEQLGGLADGPAAASYDGFLDDLRPCCARVLKAAGECDLFFVGRSPESLFDYLRGVCRATPWFGRLHLLLLSLRRLEDPGVRRDCGRGMADLRGYFTTVGLDPDSLARRRRPVAFADLVCNGETFANLIRLLHRWSTERNADWPAVRRKLRFVAIVETPSDRGRPWQKRQHEAIALLDRGAVRTIAVPRRLWRYLGDDQPKVAASYAPHRWGDPDAARPPRAERHYHALRLALQLFHTGESRPERLAFLRALAAAGAFRVAGHRSLASALRGVAKPATPRGRMGVCEILPKEVGSTVGSLQLNRWSFPRLYSPNRDRPARRRSARSRRCWSDTCQPDRAPGSRGSCRPRRRGSAVRRIRPHTPGRRLRLPSRPVGGACLSSAARPYVCGDHEAWHYLAPRGPRLVFPCRAFASSRGPTIRVSLIHSAASW